MKHSSFISFWLMTAWFLPCTLVCAQTPFDAFSPETSRIILDGDSIAAWRAEQQIQLSHRRPTHSRPDTILCALIADLRNEQLLLVDIATHRPVAAAPFTDEIKNWLSVDPLVDKNITTSPYLYCNGNPIMFIDPDGRDWYDSGDGDIKWDDRVTSQEEMDKLDIKGIYLGRNVLVGKHARDENLNEEINGAVFELYLETQKDGPTATIVGNTIPCDVKAFGTLREGLYPAKFAMYKGFPAILINDGGDLPTVCGNPNNSKNYYDGEAKKQPKPISEHVMDEVFFHYGNNYFPGLIGNNKKPWTIGCQTGGNYKGSHEDYMKFMNVVPASFNGSYYLRAK